MSNNLYELYHNTFVGLYNLVFLNLNNNFIQLITPCAFAGLNNIKKLGLKRNQISEIQRGTFCGLESLRHIDLSFNDILIIQFPNHLPRIDINFHSPELCCNIPPRVKCLSLLQPESRSFSCPRIHQAAKIFFWVLVLLVLVPNIVAPFWWRKFNRGTGRMWVLITLLHTVDTLIAVPYFVVAVADVWYGDLLSSAEWAHSMLCKSVAYVGYVAFVLSTACFTLIMRQRYLGIVSPLLKREISMAIAVWYILGNFLAASVCYVGTLIIDSLSEAVHLNPVCFIFAHPLRGWKSYWFLSLYVLVLISVIPALCFSVGIVRILTQADTVIQHKHNNRKPVFKIFVSTAIYLLTCLSLCVLGVIRTSVFVPNNTYIWIFITIFPLHALTNPWVITYLSLSKLNCARRPGITKPNRVID